MRKLIFPFLILFISVSAVSQQSSSNLFFHQLAASWDEAIPLGNGMLGALVWEKEGKLRFSLDRADLWDNRPMNGLHRKEFNFKWVQGQVLKKEYQPVQQYFDWPYDHEPAPSKIPGAAIEVNIENWGKVSSVELIIQTALCEVKWENGAKLSTFVDATKTAGWFRFEKVPDDFSLNLIAPKYTGVIKNSGDPVGGDDLSRLGYTQGKIKKENNQVTYTQEGWQGFSYRVTVKWKKTANHIVEGVWTISSAAGKKEDLDRDKTILEQAVAKGYRNSFTAHANWWKKFWAKSDLQIPDTLLQKQWYLEQYKFGSASRKGAAPISLQAIWTADNGRLPPWKGDFHHDLNTQLSYWPSYSANHLDEAMVYLDHLDQNKSNYKRYTKLYFGVDGLDVPGVTTIDGTEMGGWIQYSLSPTVSAWLSQHFYLQWRYSMDRNFLKQRAYPWIRSTAVFLEQITLKDKNGFRQLPISSSPEMNDNDLSAWFLQTTNYDLALMKFTFKAAAELALECGLKKEADHWLQILAEFPAYALSAKNELMISPTLSYNFSHRHFSNSMAIHPLGLIKWEDGEEERSIIRNTLRRLDSIGPSNWCGYSYAWLANLKARAKDGEGAAEALQIFAKAFCSSNSFHVNGDQTKSGYSDFHYKPFTLEGNFAFAAGLQEMLLQSYAGFISIMPAVPAAWKDVSFNKLRAEGAILVSAKKINGVMSSVTLVAEQGGTVKLKIPFDKWTVRSTGHVQILKKANGLITLHFEKGAGITLLNK